MILPQQRKQKEASKFRESLKVGDDVVTIGGLHGKVVSFNNETVTIQADKTAKLTFERAAISIEATRRKNAPSKTTTSTKEKGATQEEMPEAIK
jgi:preprotein translocase subunit YajC